MNIKTTVILAVLLLAVGGYLFFTRDTDDAPKKFEEHKLVDVSDVNKVVVTASDGKAMAFEKKNADWRMTQPIDAAADATEVNALIDAVTGLKATNELDAGGGTRTGLDKPQYVFELSGGKGAKVSFGDKMAVGGGMYTKVDGKDAVSVVDAGVLDRLDKPASAYRQAKLVETPSADIRQLAVTTKAGKITLQKQDDAWKVTEPQPMPADAAAVTDLLTALTNLKATSFVDDPSEQTDAMKGNPPVTSVAFSTVAPTTQPTTQPAMTTVTFGAYDDMLKKHVYAKVSNSPFIAKVDTTALTSLDKKPIELRDKKVLDVNPAEVSRFSINADVPAATQPTSRPAKKTDVAVERRQVSGGRGVPFLATTHPSTAPSLADKFELPNAKKPSPWVLADGSDATEADVTEFLTALHPLTAQKYLESNPATQPTASHYVVKLHTEAAGGAKSDVELHLADRGNDQPLVGEYNGLTFEVNRATLGRFLESDFKTKVGAGGASLPQGHPPLGTP